MCLRLGGSGTRHCGGRVVFSEYGIAEQPAWNDGRKHVPHESATDPFAGLASLWLTFPDCSWSCHIHLLSFQPSACSFVFSSKSTTAQAGLCIQERGQGFGMAMIALLSMHSSVNTIVMFAMMRPYRRFLYSWLVNLRRLVAGAKIRTLGHSARDLNKVQVG